MEADRLLYGCEEVKTSAVMVFCEKGGFGGEEDAELKELWRNGLLERLDGLVLLGLGPPAMFSFVLPLS